MRNKTLKLFQHNFISHITTIYNSSYTMHQNVTRGEDMSEMRGWNRPCFSGSLLCDDSTATKWLFYLFRSTKLRRFQC